MKPAGSDELGASRLALGAGGARLELPLPARPTNQELAMIGGLVAANVALNRFVPSEKSREIPANIGAAAILLAIAGVPEPGALSRDVARAHLKRGILAGLALGVPVGTALTIAAFFPATRRYFHDDRIVAAEAADAGYQFFARIPLATALCEELMFRVAVPAVLRRRRSRFQSEVIGASLFGLWHILPTLDRLQSNPGTASLHHSSARRKAAVVAGTVAATAVAGFGFLKLRDASGSVATPIIAHAAINGGAFLGGWLSSHLQPEEQL